MRLTAATRNRAKVEQITVLVDGLAEVVPLPIEAGHDSAPENGSSVRENAIAKARFWTERVGSNALVVATDGGLLVPTLGEQWDPIRTRRFAGESASNLQRADVLLQLTAPLTGDERQIGWLEAIAVARGDMLLGCWTAADGPGMLAESINQSAIVASGGFWIPALWRCPEYGGRLLADLTPAERAARSDHWSELGQQLRGFLVDYEREDGGRRSR